MMRCRSLVAGSDDESLDVCEHAPAASATATVMVVRTRLFMVMPFGQ